MPIPNDSFIHYVLETQNAGVDIRLLLNGVELIRGTPADKKITSEKINGWLVSGVNQIQIFAAIPDPAHSVGQTNVKCLLFRGPVGRQPDESEALLRFAQDDKTKLPAGAMQMVWQESFKPEPFYGPWIWETSQPIVQGPATVVGVFAVLRTVFAALNAHNGAEILKLLQVYVEEKARAYNEDAGRQAGYLKSWAESWVVTPVPPLAPEDYSLVVEDNHRLVRIERKDGLPLFTANVKAPASGPKRLYLTQSALGWIIVR